MYDIIRENKRNEKETRIQQLKQLLQDSTSDSDSTSSSDHSRKKKKKKKEKKKKEKKKEKKKKKKKHKAKGSDDSDSDWNSKVICLLIEAYKAFGEAAFQMAALSDEASSQLPKPSSDLLNNAWEHLILSCMECLGYGHLCHISGSFNK